ncbi:MAG TPA: phage tail sheath subtilisin-like domain-containing protein [Accumulibacter sp.]|nr:phage tail sheath subtilisin-like domain-containing protein [Accumulibacter sp.]HMW18927.1 phage tail sheath subtilisin-like domain-containing protein [Accumulibacter sp.]HMX23912.1 phage tail sheath subtilisin-like domain-containing protein [Accumulibacter sp.]HMY07057.1 phage tail sheath subtilisin-like domain-containing protein [Accumulibacter sp.]HNC19073.1 phage tail sheath subtilisin-like domain-containing protein [Accumulibacter sp.]
MPEYLAPGVYVEETSFRAKSIEGVATSTAGFVGQARFGPTRGLPTLVTSFEEFQRVFGDADELLFEGVPTTNHLAHAVRLFFENGGKRVYVARAFRAPAGGSVDGSRARSADSPAPEALSLLGTVRHIRARFPGRAGNLVISTQAIRSGNLLIGTAGNRTVSGLRLGDVVEVAGAVKDRVVQASGPQAVVSANLYAASFDAAGRPILSNAGGTLDQNAASVVAVQKITVDLRVGPNGDGSTGARVEQFSRLSPHPDSDQFIGRVLRHEDPDAGIEPPADRSQRVYFDLGDLPSTAAERTSLARDLLTALVSHPSLTLAGGSDGRVADPAAFAGGDSGHSARGLAALAEIEDIAIVSAPGAAALADSDDQQNVRDALISHCELLRYRFAILAGPATADQAQIREVRGQHDSKYAAIYYPWLVTSAPGGARETLQLSPEGAMAGIYARSDIERGVHKAPANETVRGILRFSRNVNKGEQDVLNPEGINCLRFFEGRGYRVWGARTISSDPEWTYINVRRLFIYLEHSIDRGTQWAVFEPNNEELWLKIRLTIEGFLYDVWRSGALLGSRPSEAYFVRCDRSTMSQSDLDNGRLICLIGVAPTKPAEFVIFRIGQWTADASII